MARLCIGSVRYQNVKRFILKLWGQQSPEACAVIETAPGEELQVDYGTRQWFAIGTRQIPATRPSMS